MARRTLQLNELKAALDTEARREAKAFDDENHRLKKVMTKQKAQILTLESALRTMYVKCYNATSAVPICEGCDQYGRCNMMRKEAEKKE